MIQMWCYLYGNFHYWLHQEQASNLSNITNVNVMSNVCTNTNVYVVISVIVLWTTHTYKRCSFFCEIVIDLPSWHKNHLHKWLLLCGKKSSNILIQHNIWSYILGFNKILTEHFKIEYFLSSINELVYQNG